MAIIALNNGKNGNGAPRQPESSGTPVSGQSLLAQANALVGRLRSRIEQRQHQTRQDPGETGRDVQVAARDGVHSKRSKAGVLWILSSGV